MHLKSAVHVLTETWLFLQDAQPVLFRKDLIRCEDLLLCLQLREQNIKGERSLN